MHAICAIVALKMFRLGCILLYNSWLVFFNKVINFIEVVHTKVKILIDIKLHINIYIYLAIFCQLRIIIF